MNLRDQPVLLLDCQTTGASPAHGNLLEIAWCIADAHNDPTAAIESRLVQQPEDAPIPMRIRILTGIEPDDMQNAVAPDAVQTSLLSLLQSRALSQSVIHWAQLEKAFLAELFARFTEQPELPFNVTCTYQIARRLFPNLPTRSLRGMAGFFGATTGDLKRSACHVEATWWIWRGLTSELAGRGIHDFAQLQEWLSEPVKVKRTKYEYPLERLKRLKLPDTPGVYRMLNKGGKVLYVGKATSLKSRVNSYFRGQKKKDAKTKELLTQVWDIAVTECHTPIEAALLETDEIKRLNPPYNVSLKAGRRALAFYSRDFSSVAREQDEMHPLGPFASDTVMEPFLRLYQSLTSGDFDPHIFFEGIAPSKLAEAFTMFCANYDVDTSHITSARSLMTIAMYLYRQYQQSLLEEDDEESAEEDEDEDGDDDTVDVDDHVYFDTHLSIEELSERFGRMLVRAAGAYLQTKRLTLCLNAQVEYSQKGKARSLLIRHGTIIINEDSHPDTLADAYESEKPFPWNGLDITTYDRMRVLLSELTKSEQSLCTPIR